MLKKLKVLGFACLTIFMSGINFHTECKVLPNASYKIEEGITSFGTVPHDSLWTAYYTSSGDLIKKVPSTSKEQYELDPNAPKPQVTASAIKYWDKNFTYTWTKRPWQTTPLTFGGPGNYYLVLYDRHGNRISMRRYFPHADLVESIIDGRKKTINRAKFCVSASGREEVEPYQTHDCLDYCSTKDRYLRIFKKNQFLDYCNTRNHCLHHFKKNQDTLDEKAFLKWADAYLTLAEDFLVIPKYCINNKAVAPSYYKACINHMEATYMYEYITSSTIEGRDRTGAELKKIISRIKKYCHLDDLCVEEEFNKTQDLIYEACEYFHTQKSKLCCSDCCSSECRLRYAD